MDGRTLPSAFLEAELSASPEKSRKSSVREFPSTVKAQN